jgi:hypothetical protein
MDQRLAMRAVAERLLDGAIAPSPAGTPVGQPAADKPAEGKAPEGNASDGKASDGKPGE